MKMTQMNHPTEPTQPVLTGKGDHNMDTAGGMEAKPKLSTLNLVIVSLLSMAMLAGGFALAARYGDLSMRAAATSMKMPSQTGAMPVQNRVMLKNDRFKTQGTKDMKGMKMPDH